MEMPVPQLRPRAVRKALREVADLKQAANRVTNAMRSPRCMLRWEADENGDMWAIWIADGCTQETSQNCSALKRRMDEMVKLFGADVMKSRTGRTVDLEIPSLR